MSKKIHVVTKFFYPVAAGIETNILETYCVLVEKGWDVTIFTTSNSHIQKKLYPPRDQIKGLKVVRLNDSQYFQGKTIFNNNPDIIALHNFDVLPHLLIMLYTIYLKLRGKKSFAFTVTPHGGFNPEWRVFKPVTALLKYIYHYGLGMILINLSADLVRAVSVWEKEEMIIHGINKDLIQVIPNGIEDEGFRNVEAEASPEIKSKVASWGQYIIQIGRIYPIKNYETVIKALPLIPAEISFVILGPVSDVTYKQKLEQLAARTGVSERLIFGGVVRGIDKFYVIKHAAAMVHMAIWESFCNVIHEAMSQSIPIIAANNTALPYLIQHMINGLLVSTFDEYQLSQAVTFVLDPENAQAVKQITQRNVIKAQEETWRNTALIMEAQYVACLSS